MSSKTLSVKALDARTITIKGFTLTETGLTVKGSPTFADYEGVGAFILRTHKAAGWWVADWVTYGQDRADWHDRIDAVIDSETLTEQGVRQYRYIATHVPLERRVPGVPFAHHGEVASLPPAEQTAWLQKTMRAGWTQRELRTEIRASKRRTVLTGSAPTMHSVEVEVVFTLDVEAETAVHAEASAWEQIKARVEPLKGRVIGAHAKGKPV